MITRVATVIIVSNTIDLKRLTRLTKGSSESTLLSTDGTESRLTMDEHWPFIRFKLVHKINKIKDL
uniref:Uncharacterized protein n=1 Tax=Tetranychus urticae TaxID=32264 RepID=T1K074_TETUR